MKNEKLALAAQAAGYAMVHQDELETVAGEHQPPSTRTHPAPPPKVEKPTFAQDWYNYFAGRVPG